MVHYNFYLDHIEVVLDGDVILDSRTHGMMRVLDELSYDITTLKIAYPKECARKSFNALVNIIDFLFTISHPEQLDVFSFLRNHFIASRRRNFYHFRVYILNSK